MPHWPSVLAGEWSLAAANVAQTLLSVLPFGPDACRQILRRRIGQGDLTTPHHDSWARRSPREAAWIARRRILQPLRLNDTDKKMWNLAEFVGRMKDLPPSVKSALLVKRP